MNDENKIKELITKLGEENNEDSIKSISDPITELRNSTATFISQRFNRLKEESDFAVFLREAIKQKVENNEATFSDIATMLNQTKLRETEAVESLLQFFKPNSNAESSILLNKKDDESDSYTIDHKSVKTLELLRRMLEQVQNNHIEQND